MKHLNKIGAKNKWFILSVVLAVLAVNVTYNAIIGEEDVKEVDAISCEDQALLDLLECDDYCDHAYPIGSPPDPLYFDDWEQCVNDCWSDYYYTLAYGCPPLY